MSLSIFTLQSATCKQVLLVHTDTLITQKTWADADKVDPKVQRLCFYCAILLKTWIIKINAGIVTAISKSLLIILRLKKGFDIFFSSSSFPFLPSPGQVNPQIYIQGQTLPSHFPEDCIMSLFFVAGVDISSSASWRNPSLNALPWGFPQELAVMSKKQLM